jgi:hypothetical protein
MPLAQVYITAATNDNRYFSLPMSGRCNIRILNVQSDFGGPTALAQLKSDQLILPLSPMRFFSWIHKADDTIVFDSSNKEYHFQDIPVYGKIQLQVVDYTTGLPVPAFVDALITFSIEELRNNL